MLKKVPIVKGALPYIGHAHLMNWMGTKEFLLTCYKQYGGIFQIKSGLKTMVIVGDRSLVSLFFKQKEENYSLALALISANFVMSFHDESRLAVSTALERLRRAVSCDKDDVVPKIEREAQVCIDRLKESCQSAEGGEFRTNMESEVYRYIARSTYASFMSKELSEPLFQEMREFFYLVNINVLSSYFIPKCLGKFWWNSKLCRMRNSISAQLERHIDIPENRETPFMKNAVAFGETLGEIEVKADAGRLISSFIYVSSENTTIGLLNTLQFLVAPENTAILTQLRIECEERIGNLDDLLKAPFLHACVLESARLTTNFISTLRVSTDSGPESHVFGDYAIGGGVDYIALSGAMMAFNEVDPAVQIFGDFPCTHHLTIHPHVGRWSSCLSWQSFCSHGTQGRSCLVGFEF
jgi:hypothetical protein